MAVEPLMTSTDAFSTLTWTNTWATSCSTPSSHSISTTTMTSTITFQMTDQNPSTRTTLRPYHLPTLRKCLDFTQMLRSATTRMLPKTFGLISLIYNHRQVNRGLVSVARLTSTKWPRTSSEKCHSSSTWI